MKKHILIGIPCLLLHFSSFAILVHSIDSWYRYEQVEKSLQALKPITYPEHLIQHMEELGVSDNKVALAAKLVVSAQNEVKAKHNLEMDVISSTKGKFLVQIYFGAISLILSVMLIIGLAPQFKKGSNN